MSFILGRPWQYERKVIHNGGKNIYTFWKDGSKTILLPLKDEGKAENMLSEKEPVTEIMVTRFCYALMVQRREGGDITIHTEATKLLEEKKDMSVVQENISSLGTIQLMITRRRWTDNKPFQARQWRKIVHISDRENHSCSTRPIQLISGTMGRCSTSRKSLGYSEEKKIEDNNLQDLR